MCCIYFINTHSHVAIVVCLKGSKEAGGYFLIADEVSGLSQGEMRWCGIESFLEAHE